MDRSEKIKKVLSLAFGILFLFIGIIMIIFSVGVNVRMVSCRRVNARVADVIETHSKPRKNMEVIYYTPVYEYYCDGDVRTYKSTVSTTSMTAETGSEATLYISENGIVYERTGTLTTLSMGIIFAVWGIGIFGVYHRKKH